VGFKKNGISSLSEVFNFYKSNEKIVQRNQEKLAFYDLLVVTTVQGQVQAPIATSKRASSTPQFEQHELPGY